MAAQRVQDILAAIAGTLNDLPDVFSSAQWGGRAYKLPGPSGSMKRPKLLAFVVVADDGQGVLVTFKLEKKRAAQVIRQHAWIAREPFGSLGKSGWVLACVRAKFQLRTLAKLLAETRALHPVRANERSTGSPSREDVARSQRGGEISDPVARRIDRVMLEVKSNGWSPRDDSDAAFAESISERRRPRRAENLAP